MFISIVRIDLLLADTSEAGLKPNERGGNHRRSDIAGEEEVVEHDLSGESLRNVIRFLGVSLQQQQQRWIKLNLLNAADGRRRYAAARLTDSHEKL